MKDVSEAKKIAKKIGYPVVHFKKATAGGDEGCWYCRDEKELETGFQMTEQEAELHLVMVDFIWRNS